MKRKFFIGFLVGVILATGVVSFSPQAKAFTDGSGWAILTNDIANFATEIAEWIERKLVPILRDQVVKRIIDDMTDDLVNAIARGESPLFVQDWEAFLGKAGDIAFDEMNTYLMQSTGVDLCAPIRPQLQIYLSFLGNTNRLGIPVRCSISDFKRNVQYSYKNLIERNGWISFRQMYNNPSNNFIGAALVIDDAIARNATRMNQARQSEATAASGFLSQTTCLEWSDPDPETGEKECLKEEVTTPGDVAAQAATKATLKDFPYIENVQSVISAIVNKTINDIFSPRQGGGLAAAGNRSSIAFDTGSKDDQRDQLGRMADKWGQIILYFEEIKDRTTAALYTSEFVPDMNMGSILYNRFWFKFPRNAITNYPEPGDDEMTEEERDTLYEACTYGSGDEALPESGYISAIDAARCFCLNDDFSNGRSAPPVTDERFGWLAYGNEYGTRSHVRLGISDFSDLDYLKDYFRDIYKGVYNGLPIAQESLARVQEIIERYDNGDFDDPPGGLDFEEDVIADLPGGPSQEEETDKGIDLLKIIRDETSALSDFTSKFRYANEVTVPYGGGGPGAVGGSVQRKTLYAVESILTSLAFPLPDDVGSSAAPPGAPENNFFYCKAR